ncbi:MAG TPA: M57 family metalloprotease [Tidjanibacter sp.]|nr:M57 family metalloprotease [Tidjanibacter sp.]
MINSETKTAQQLQQEADIYLIGQMGYDTSAVSVTERGYVVEGDILLRHEYLAELKTIEPTRQTQDVSRNVVSAEKRTINIVTSGVLDYYDAIQEAIDYWNQKAQCAITFATSGAGEIVISAEYNSDNDDTSLMFVTPPDFSGNPGSVIINMSCTYRPGTGTTQARDMILHAIGHAIGFGHTACANDPTPDDTTPILGLSGLDEKSIMTKETNPLGWSGFSENDIKAFKAVYPTDEPEPEPEVDFSDRSMEWIADDGFAIAMGGPYAYGSVNIDVRVRLTGSEWADGQVRGMRIYDLYTGEEVMRGKAGSCRLQPGEYTLHYGAAVRREDGTFECRYGTADFEVTLPGFELTMPILSHPEDIDLSRTIVVRCSFETDDAAWRNFSCSVELVNLRTGEEITHQSYTPNERWAFRLTERGTYRAVATVSNGSETLVIRKDFVLPELTNPKDIYHTLNWRAIDFDKVIQYYIDFYSDEACTEKLSLQHSAACHYIVWRRHHDAEGNPTKNDKVMEDTVMLPAGVTTYNLPYTFEAKDYLTLHGYRYDYEIVGIEYR